MIAQTAVYDIAARKVYLPDGTVLEAHSGLGAKMDDVRYAHVRMQGVTPPHIYELTPREALFHGVPALRLTPIGGEDKIFGRDGLLAHTYMLGPERQLQRLRVVQGLLRIPRRLPQRASGGSRWWRRCSKRTPDARSIHRDRSQPGFEFQTAKCNLAARIAPEVCFFELAL